MNSKLQSMALSAATHNSWFDAKKSAPALPVTEQGPTSWLFGFNG